MPDKTYVLVTIDSGDGDESAVIGPASPDIEVIIVDIEYLEMNGDDTAKGEAGVIMEKLKAIPIPPGDRWVTETIKRVQAVIDSPVKTNYTRKDRDSDDIALLKQQVVTLCCGS